MERFPPGSRRRGAAHTARPGSQPSPKRSVMATSKAHYSKAGIAAIVGGTALTSVEVLGATSYLIGQSQPSYLVAGGAIVTIVSAGLPLLAERAWKAKRRTLSLLLWAALLPALFTIFCAAVERTGGARDRGRTGSVRRLRSGSSWLGSRCRMPRLQAMPTRQRPLPNAPEPSRAAREGRSARQPRGGQMPAGNGCKLPVTRRRTSASSPRKLPGRAARRNPAGLRRICTLTNRSFCRWQFRSSDCC